MEKNIKMVVSYDGTGYHGFQRQKNALTVQEVLEKSLAKIYRYPVILQASSRTDTGVHARGQVVNFRSPFSIPEEKVALALNALLPRDIRVLKSEEVPLYFHSRFDAVEKLYTYLVDRGETLSVFHRLYALHYPRPLDLEALQEGARCLLGRHDFTSFCASGSQAKSREREIREARWEEEGPFLRFVVRGDGFLYHMVRIIVGTLLRAGQGKLPPGGVAFVLGARDRKLAGPTAPARGLCLEKVFFKG